jgi:ketosteroid isomerase-like protein
MAREDNIRRHEALYAFLKAGDWAGFIAAFPEKCLFNVFGHTPLSGSFTDRDEFFANGAEERATRLAPGAQFATKSRILIADDHYSVGLMETAAMGTNGVPYDQQYIQILGHRDGQIVEYWEYLDTVVLESVIYDNHLATPRAAPRNPIDILFAVAGSDGGN